MTENEPDDNAPEVMSNQELQQSLVYLEQLKEQIATLREQLEILELAVKEHNQAIETLKDFDKLENNNELLVPIGADTLVFAKILDKSKVIINVGAGIAMEDNIKSGIDKLTERIERIEVNKNKIATSINSLQDQAIQLSQRVETAYQAIQQQSGSGLNPGPPNVS